MFLNDLDNSLVVFFFFFKRATKAYAEKRLTKVPYRSDDRLSQTHANSSTFSARIPRVLTSTSCYERSSFRPCVTTTVERGETPTLLDGGDSMATASRFIEPQGVLILDLITKNID